MYFGNGNLQLLVCRNALPNKDFEKEDVKHNKILSRCTFKNNYLKINLMYSFLTALYIYKTFEYSQLRKKMHVLILFYLKNK